MITGGTYLERGRPVLVLAQWRDAKPGDTPGQALPGDDPLAPIRSRRVPRNVLIRHADGSETIRPFRGLRRPPDDQAG